MQLLDSIFSSPPQIKSYVFGYRRVHVRRCHVLVIFQRTRASSSGFSIKPRTGPPPHWRRKVRMNSAIFVRGPITEQFFQASAISLALGSLLAITCHNPSQRQERAERFARSQCPCQAATNDSLSKILEALPPATFCTAMDVNYLSKFESDPLNRNLWGPQL